MSIQRFCFYVLDFKSYHHQQRLCGGFGGAFVMHWRACARATSPQKAAMFIIVSSCLPHLGIGLPVQVDRPPKREQGGLMITTFTRDIAR